MWKKAAIVLIAIMQGVCVSASSTRQGTLQAAIYTSSSSQHKEYAEFGVRVIPGISIAIGGSVVQPEDFYYGLMSLHSSQKLVGFSPAVQIGLTHFEANDYWPKPTENSGLLMGISLQYPINYLSALELNHKIVNDSFNLVHGREKITTIGVRFFL